MQAMRNFALQINILLVIKILARRHPYSMSLKGAAIFGRSSAKNPARRGKQAVSVPGRRHRPAAPAQARKTDKSDVMALYRQFWEMRVRTGLKRYCFPRGVLTNSLHRLQDAQASVPAARRRYAKRKPSCSTLFRRSLRPKCPFLTARIHYRHLTAPRSSTP